MTRKQKLKVYRTPIGFHDAYVAASSQKAALQLWGTDADLFARGMAEIVTDPELGREPLENPGTIVRRARGTSDEHMAALSKDRPSRKRPLTKEHEGERMTQRERKPATSGPVERSQTTEDTAAMLSKGAADRPGQKRSPARPSRAKLEKAEQVLSQAQADHENAIAAIRQREKDLQQQRRDLEQRYETEMTRLVSAVEEARESYGTALRKWRI